MLAIFLFYLAYSIILVSLINVTLILPGYLSSFSILFAMSLATSLAVPSSILSLFTITLISLPACIAKDLSTPSRLSAIF